MVPDKRAKSPGNPRANGSRRSNASSPSNTQAREARSPGIRPVLLRPYRNGAGYTGGAGPPPGTEQTRPHRPHTHRPVRRNPLGGQMPFTLQEKQGARKPVDSVHPESPLPSRAFQRVPPPEAREAAEIAVCTDPITIVHDSKGRVPGIGNQLALNG